MADRVNLGSDLKHRAVIMHMVQGKEKDALGQYPVEEKPFAVCGAG